MFCSRVISRNVDDFLNFFCQIFCHQLFLTLSTNQKEGKKMQRKWLEHFCKYRHICEFLGNEGKEKEEIKEYLIQELGLPEWSIVK